MKTPTLPSYAPKSAPLGHLPFSKNIELYGPPPSGYRWRSVGDKTTKRDIVALGWDGTFIWEKNYGGTGRRICHASWPVATPVRTPAKRDHKGRFAPKTPAAKTLPDVGEKFRRYHGDYSAGSCGKNISALKMVLAAPVENHKGIMTCFTWSDTTQGWQYWHDRCYKNAPLSADDLDYLRAAKAFFEERIKELSPKPVPAPQPAAPTVPELQAKISSLEAEVADLKRRMAGAKVVFPSMKRN